jgi:hypothetical protein
MNDPDDEDEDDNDEDVVDIAHPIVGLYVGAPRLSLAKQGRQQSLSRSAGQRMLEYIYIYIERERQSSRMHTRKVVLNRYDFGLL